LFGLATLTQLERADRGSGKRIATNLPVGSVRPHKFSTTYASLDPINWASCYLGEQHCRLVGTSAAWAHFRRGAGGVNWSKSMVLTLFFRRKLAIPISSAALICAMAFAVLFALRLSDNVHVVEPGLAYRSGRLSPSTLEAVVADYGIRSIISLVPPTPHEYWYRAERTLSAARHIAHYEMPLSAENELTSDQLHELLMLLRGAPKPMLIQSTSGADRSGLAAAIFKYAIASRSVEEAKGQLSIRYGHVPCLWRGTGAMDASFQRFLREGRANAASS
jgi:hypothetical protein